MKFELHFILKDGSEDVLTVERETLDEIRAVARKEYEKRGAVDAWSEQVK